MLVMPKKSRTKQCRLISPTIGHISDAQTTHSMCVQTCRIKSDNGGISYWMQSNNSIDKH